jgi:hypothetical protein
MKPYGLAGFRTQVNNAVKTGLVARLSGSILLAEAHDIDSSCSRGFRDSSGHERIKPCVIIIVFFTIFWRSEDFRSVRRRARSDDLVRGFDTRRQAPMASHQARLYQHGERERKRPALGGVV